MVAAAFSSAAQKDCYGELGVERYTWICSFDKDTCQLCGSMDGQVFKLSDYQVGLTAPPGHPWCRCCTCPYFEDMTKLGERWTRNPDGTTEKVPVDMSFEEWKQQFVKEDLEEIFQSVGDYIRQDGSFDLDAALADYEKFLQTVPEKNRIYLQQAMKAVEYQQIDLAGTTFGYLSSDTVFQGKKLLGDTVYFNPAHPMFSAYDFRVVNTHELGHRIDQMFVRSWESPPFLQAIQNGKQKIVKNASDFVQFCKKHDEDGFLSDILSAICKDEVRFPTWHEKAYWAVSGNQQKDIFANLFSLEAYQDKEKLDFLQLHFPDLMKEYRALNFEIG